MNEEKHWNSIGKNYNDEIFDVFKSNKNGKLQRYFKKNASQKSIAIDFGCGTGKAFEYLSPSFKKVLAIDIAENLLDIAKSTDYSNISFQRLDLTEDTLNLPPTDFAFCCNVAILPDQEKNISIIKNIHKTLRSRGKAVIVVPSLESALFSSWRLVDWYNKEGVHVTEIPKDEIHIKSGTDAAQGIIHIEGVPTKHYLQSELETLLSNVNFSINAIDKLEYDWSTEFDSPPSWMKEPYPWDWLVECTKN
jgi:SAM-dependent methyltransferase